MIERANAGLATAKLKGNTGGRKKGLSKEALKKTNAAKRLYDDKDMLK